MPARTCEHVRMHARERHRMTAGGLPARMT